MKRPRDARHKCDDWGDNPRRAIETTELFARIANIHLGRNVLNLGGSPRLLELRLQAGGEDIGVTSAVSRIIEPDMAVVELQLDVRVQVPVEPERVFGNPTALDVLVIKVSPGKAVGNLPRAAAPTLPPA
jgi:hypothetical protein